MCRACKSKGSDKRQTNKFQPGELVRVKGLTRAAEVHLDIINGYVLQVDNAWGDNYQLLKMETGKPLRGLVHKQFLVHEHDECEVCGSCHHHEKCPNCFAGHPREWDCPPAHGAACREQQRAFIEGWKPDESRFHQGQKVRITKGPQKGAIGYISSPSKVDDHNVPTYRVQEENERFNWDFAAGVLEPAPLFEAGQKAVYTGKDRGWLKQGVIVILTNYQSSPIGKGWWVVSDEDPQIRAPVWTKENYLRPYVHLGGVKEALVKAEFYTELYDSHNKEQEMHTDRNYDRLQVIERAEVKLEEAKAQHQDELNEAASKLRELADRFEDPEDDAEMEEIAEKWQELSRHRRSKNRVEDLELLLENLRLVHDETILLDGSERGLLELS